MDYLDLLYDQRRNFEDLVVEAEFRYEAEREERQLKYLEKRRNKNEHISKN